MSSQENTMDAEEYKNWIEQHLTDVAVCGAGRMGRKARREIDKARKVSELESLNLKTTTEAIEPKEEIKWGTSLVNNIVAMRNSVGEVIGPTIARTAKYPSDIRE